MEKIVERKDCCGCAACFASCPHQAISIEDDEYGFAYPVIESNRCVNCGLCRSVCPIIKRDNKEFIVDNQEYYACHNNDLNEWKLSSSGGIFRIFADYVINGGGYVVGAVYDDDMVVRHVITNKEEELDRFRGSKYVQSDTSSVYKKVKDVLKDGHIVLFTGTPCQVEAIKCYLRKPFTNLLTCDLICTSVPSPLVFRDYIRYIEKKYGQKVININMKDKTKGWPNTKTRIFFENGKSLYDTIDSDMWFDAWTKSLFTRPSCENCRFTNYNRPGDITIGDCWPIFHKSNSFLSPNGISQLMINTSMGRQFFDAIKDKMSLMPITKDYSWQSKLEYPITSNALSSEFWKDYKLMSFHQIAQKYWNYSIIRYYKRKYLPMIKGFPTKIVHKLLKR